VKGRNEPCNIVRVAEVVSKLLNIEMEVLTEKCFQNTIKCFDIKM